MPRPHRRAARSHALLAAAGLALAACTGATPAAVTTTSPPAVYVAASPDTGDHVLTELAAEVTPEGVVLSWKVSERYAARVTGFTCVYRSPAHILLEVAGSVACGEPLSAAAARQRVVAGLPEFGDYLFEVVAQVGTGPVIDWPKRALQVQLPVTQELAGPSGPDAAVIGTGPLVLGCGPGDGRGDAPPERPWHRSDIVSAEHLTHYPGRAWAPGGDADAPAEWPEPPSLAQVFDETGLDGQAIRRVLGGAGAGPADGEAAGDDTGSGGGDRESAVEDARALLADDSSAAALARASAGTKALVRRVAGDIWELKLHTSYPFGAHYEYRADHAVNGWGDPTHPVAWAELRNRTDCPPTGNPSATHDVALALSDDAGDGRRLEHSGYGWWAVAPVGMFPERIVATKGGLAYGDPVTAASPASPASWQGRVSGHLFWDRRRFALAGDLTLASTHDGVSAPLSGRVDNVVLVPLDHATLEPLGEPPAPWGTFSLDAGRPRGSGPAGTAWSGTIALAGQPAGAASPQMPPPETFLGDWHAQARGPDGLEITGHLRLWTPLPEGGDPDEGWPAQAVIVAGFGAIRSP